MEGKGRLIEEIELGNGIRLSFWDVSRRLAGDRWYVGLVLRIPIEVREEDFAHLEDGPSLYREFKEKEGDLVWFEAKKERHFIDEREKDEILEGLLRRLKEHSLSYLSHPAFAERFKRRRIEEFLERRNWWRE